MKAKCRLTPGYFLAVATLIRMSGEDTDTDQLIGCFGAPDISQIEPYDLEAVMPSLMRLGFVKKADRGGICVVNPED